MADLGDSLPSSFHEMMAVAAVVGRKIESFSDMHRLPVEWFMSPDHIAFKAYDKEQYQAMMNATRGYSVRQTVCAQGGRVLGTTELSDPIGLGVFGEIDWVEIMEPRPEKVGKDPVGLDHVEFCFGDFDTVTRVLGLRAILFERQQNESHAWVSFFADGIEVKLNDGDLATVVADELEDGRAVVSWSSS